MKKKLRSKTKEASIYSQTRALNWYNQSHHHCLHLPMPCYPHPKKPPSFLQHNKNLHPRHTNNNSHTTLYPFHDCLATHHCELSQFMQENWPVFTTANPYHQDPKTTTAKESHKSMPGTRSIQSTTSTSAPPMPSGIAQLGRCSEGAIGQSPRWGQVHDRQVQRVCGTPCDQTLVIV